MDDFDLDLDDIEAVDLAGVDDAGVDADLEDVPDVSFGSTVISGGSAVEAVDADDLIIAADGTGFGSPADYVSDSNPYDPV